MFCVAIAIVGCGNPSEPVSTVLVDGLAAPRGLSLTHDGRLLIAETGGGRILEVDPDGDVRAVASGLPHSLDSGPGNAYPAGPSAAGYIDNELQVLVGEFRGDRFARLYRVADTESYEPITAPNDAFSAAVDRFANPFDMTPAPDIGGWIVSDSGRNALVAVGGNGEVSDYAIFQRFSSPVREAPIEIVPTGINRGPDGSLYVGSLTGFPYPEGEAAVWRVTDLNQDGDAMDAGEVEVYVSGLTTVTDVAFGDDGALYIAEFSSDMQSVITGGDIAENAPRFRGRVLRWQGNELSVVIDGLVSPTGIVVSGNVLYVSEEFAGRVVRIDLDIPLGLIQSESKRMPCC